MSSKQFSMFTHSAPADVEQPISGTVSVSRDMPTAFLYNDAWPTVDAGLTTAIHTPLLKPARKVITAA